MRIGRRNFLGGAASAGLLHAVTGTASAAQKKNLDQNRPLRRGHLSA